MADQKSPTKDKDGDAAPHHVAIIMDGNGRWAAQRGLPRSEGHRIGVEALRRTVRAAGELGIQIVTIYSFSMENWSRPKQEILDLMGLLRRFIRHDLAELHGNNVRVRIIGARTGLESEILRLLEEAEELTKNNTGTTLVVAFNYGSRQEIAAATRRVAEDVAAGRLDPADITVGPLNGRSSTPPAFPIRIWLSAPAANSVCRTSCCGRPPTANWCSSRSTGRSSIAPRLKPRSPNIAAASAGFGGLVARTGS